MSKTKNKSSEDKEEKNEPAVLQEEVIPPEPRFLTEEALYLCNVWQKRESPRELVPPQTPNSEYNFANTLHPFPETFPELDSLEIPYVRDKGVKFCIDALGEYFGCKDYKFNLLQFWFLDVLTDSIWSAQDNFHLPDNQQKIVLAWILYLINLVRDPEKNMSRKAFFTVFKEAMLVAAEVVDEGCETVPLPEKLFALIQEEEEIKSWTSSDSESNSSSVDIISDRDFDNISCIDLEIDEKRRRFVLPEEVCNCAKYDLSSVDSVPESQSLLTSSEEKLTEGEEEQEKEEDEEEKSEDVEFYQPDLNMPSRFLPLSETEEIEEEFTEVLSQPEKLMCKMQFYENRNTSIKHASNQKGGEETEEGHCSVYEIPEKFCIRRTSEVSKSANTLSDTVESSTSNLEETDTSQNQNSKTKFQRGSIQSRKKSADKTLLNSKRFEQYKKKEVLKDLAFQKLWEQRLKDMANPRKGWIPSADEVGAAVKDKDDVEEEEEQTSEDADESDNEEWADITLKEQKEQVQKDEDKLILNFGVFRAIIDFVFKYFYESFQFTLIKLAFQATPEIITHKVNREWKIPKRIKQELQKPKVEKEKKKKEPKEKKSKPPKESKKGKNDKGKKDRDSKLAKKDTVSKASKKDNKKEKKQKPAQLTKEEKAELERQRKEQARLEEELRKLEEDKRFMLPLSDAASDDLFKNIFENWVKMDLTKKGKDKRGKGKK